MALLVPLALLVLPARAAPQDTSRAGRVDAHRDSLALSADSLAARLRRAEAAIALLQQQLGDQASRAAQTRSRARIELHGRAVVNAFANSRRVNNVDDPQFVRPDTVSALPVRGAGMAARQTALGLVVFVPDVAGGSFTGDVDVDFYGGQQPSGGGRTFPLLRLRTARGTLRWTRGELMVGQEMPLVAGQNPVSPAAAGTPDFVAAGNLWLWLPQVRLTGELLRAGSADRAFSLGLQGAVLAPTSGDPAGAFDTDLDAAERSQRPFLETRLRARWGAADAEPVGEIGCGAHLGWLAVARAAGAPPSETPLVQSRAVACDLRVPIGPFVEVRGEAYDGQALRGLGAGGIAQNLGRGSIALRGRGGWAQVNVRPSPAYSSGIGCGVDDPRDADLAGTGAGARLRNRACAAYTILHVADPLFLGLEARRLTTTYPAGSFTNDHLNVALGFEF